MTTTPDTPLDDLLVPALDLDPVDELDLTADDDAAVDPAVVSLADTELVGPDDTHLGIIEVELLPIHVHDDLDQSILGVGSPEPSPEEFASEPFGLDLDFGVG